MDYSTDASKEKYIELERFYILANASTMKNSGHLYAAQNLLGWYDSQPNKSHAQCTFVLQCLKGNTRRKHYSNVDLKEKWDDRVNTSEQAMGLRCAGNNSESASLLANAVPEENELMVYSVTHGYTTQKFLVWTKPTLARVLTVLTAMDYSTDASKEKYIELERFYILANASTMKKKRNLYAAQNLLGWYDSQPNKSHAQCTFVLQCLKEYSGSQKGTNVNLKEKWDDRVNTSEQAMELRCAGKDNASASLLASVNPQPKTKTKKKNKRSAPSSSSSSTAKIAPRQRKRKKEDAGTGKETGKETFKTRQMTATTNVAIGTTLRVKILEEGVPVVYSAVVVE
jgi:hypothetical protein